MPVPDSWSADRAADIIAAHTALEGPMLPILHAFQEAFGCIPDPALPMVASALNLSRAEVHGVVSFYHDFRKAPAGRRVVKICRGEACQSMGGETIAQEVLRKLWIDWGDTTADGNLTVEPVYCLGLCACAPAALVDEEPVGRLDAPGLAALVQGGPHA